LSKIWAEKQFLASKFFFTKIRYKKMKSFQQFRTFAALLLFFAIPRLMTAQTVQTMLNPSNPFLQTNVESIDPSGWLYFKNSSEVKEGELFGIHKSEMGFGSDDAMVFKQTEIDSKGNQHNRYQQYHKGYLVEGGEMIEHLEDCKVILVNGKFIENLNGNIAGTISESSALLFALAAVGASSYAWQDTTWENSLKEEKVDPNATYFPKGELYWAYPTPTNFAPSNYKLTWVFIVLSTTPFALQKVFINAKNGVIEKKINLNICNGPGTTSYNGIQQLDTKWTGGFNHNHFHMIANDGGRNIETKRGSVSISPFNKIDHLHDGDDVWLADDVLNSSAHWSITESWKYFKTFFNRKNWNNQNQKINVLSDVTLLNNAFCFPPLNLVVFGVSSGTNAQFGAAGTNLATVDIAGHEYTHGVVASTAGLVNNGESGALNESFADIFGILIEQSATGNIDWVNGNDLGGGGLRSISNPDNILQQWLPFCGLPVSGQPITYQGVNWFPTNSLCDNGGVHMNNSVQNRWFFLLSQGGVQNGITVQGITTGSAAQIVYLNLTAFLVSTSNYLASRVGSIAAATALFGACSNEVIQTTNAWAAVGVGQAFISTCATINGVSSVCANDYGIEYVASGLLGSNFTWTFPASWYATISGINSQKLTVNSFGTLAMSGSITASSSLGGSASFSVHVRTGASCNHSFCGGADDRNLQTLDFSANKVYPNPANGYIRISGTDKNSTTVKFFNITGNQILDFPNYQFGSNIDISAFKSGIYFIILENESIRISQRFTKID
jgi:bacillolysin